MVYQHILPKSVLIGCLMVTLCTNLGYSNEYDAYSDLPESDNNNEINELNEGRGLSLAAASHPAVAVASGLVTAGLLGSALFAAAGPPSNRRSYDNPYYYADRQDIIQASNAQYADNIKAFEQRLFGGAARSALRGFRNMRRSGKHLNRGLRKAARAMGHNTVEGIQAMGRSTSKMAKSAGKGMNSMARMAGRGIAKVGNVARRGMSSVGNGLQRVGFRTKTFGRKLAGVGVAAARGLRNVGDSYRRNVVDARSSLGHGLYYVGDKISRVGNAYTRGLNRLGSAYQRSIRRLGYVKPTLQNAVQDSVSRIGELASVSAAKFGGIATDVTDRVSRVAEVASDLPKSLSNVAREKKVQDCFLQAMCYLSTPYLSRNEVRRRKRALGSIPENGGWENFQDSLLYDDEENGEEYKDLNEERRNDDKYFDKNVRMDDCEVFECSVATLGRRVYGAVRRFGDR